MYLQRCLSGPAQRLCVSWRKIAISRIQDEHEYAAGYSSLQRELHNRKLFESGVGSVAVPAAVLPTLRERHAKNEALC